MRFFGHAREGAGMVGPILRRLRFSGAEIRLVEAMVREHLRPLADSEGRPTHAPRAIPLLS